MSKHKQSSAQAMRAAQKAMGAAKKKLYMQAALMCCTVVLTVVTLFAMTAAWYTNVIQTGTLMIEAETWGFQGEVLLEVDEAAPLLAAPGDSGVIELTVENQGDSPSVVSVSVSKALTESAELMQRIYFYVDEAVTKNGEVVSRQYLTNSNGYSYTMFPQETLLLTEKVHTDALVRWEWVYDMLGYYFKGTVDPNSDKLQVVEYLRPLVYDYDNAVFEELTENDIENDKTESLLLALDGGETSLAEFLVELTKTDGYSGSYSTTTDETSGAVTLKDAKGNPISYDTLEYDKCFPIDEENGIWLYVASKEDIDSNTDWDTDYGMGQNNVQLHARITVTGHQLHKEAVTVSDQAELEKLLNETTNGIVQLTNDLELTENVALTTGADVMLDLNGHTIRYNSTAAEPEPAFTLGSGAGLTVMNGTLSGDSNTTKLIESVGGQLTLHDVTVDNVYNAVVVNDHLTERAQGDNSVVRISSSNLTSSMVTVAFSGDGSASEGITTLIIQDSTLESTGWAPISGNGSVTPAPGRWGTDIQVINSTLKGFYTGIYHPQPYSTLTISNSTVSGITGLAIKGGTVEIIDSVISGTGTSDQIVTINDETELPKSGFLDTGDGIYLETNYNYPITLNISGSKTIVTSAKAKALRVYPDSIYVKVNITGGSFSTDVEEYLAEGCVQTSNGGLYEVNKAPVTEPEA